MDDAIGAEITVLKPTVDLVLENEEFTSPGFEGFASGSLIDVVVRVQPSGQNVDTVFAALDFDTRDLEVVNVSNGDGRLDQVLVNSVDNRRGEIVFSAFTLDPAPSDDFVLTVVRFRAKRSTRSLSVGFREDSDAVFSAASVLRELRGFAAEMSLELRFRSFQAPNFDADVVVNVRPNGNRIDTVASFIDFTPGGMEVNGISPGRRLETVLLSAFDNSIGILDYTALTVSRPAIGEFDLAVVDSVLIGDLDSLANIQVLFVGETGAAFNSEPVPLVLTSLLTLRPDAPGPLENLTKTTPSNDTTPTIQWGPPLSRPSAGIRTFRMTISGTGDTPDPQGLQGVDVLDIGDVRCRDVAGGPTPCLGDFEFNLDQVATVRFTLAPDLTLPDGRYRLALIAVDNLGIGGEETVLLDGFIVDTTPPEPFVLLSPDPGEEPTAFVKIRNPVTEWSAAADELSDVFYDVEVDDNRDLSSPEAFIQLGTTAWTVVRPDGTLLDPSLEYFWRVRATDDAGQPPGVVALGEVAQAQQELVQGNQGLFTEPFSFTVDIGPPGAPTDLRSISIGGNVTNDSTPTFQWIRSVDDFGVALYEIAITRINTDGIVGQVLDEECDDTTGLCTFTVSDGDALTDDQNGAHTITVTVADQAGNTADESAAFTFDDTPPTAPLIDPETFIVGGETTERTPDGNSFLIQWARSTDPGFPGTGSGVDFYTVAIDPVNVTGTADDSDDEAVCPGGLCQFRTPPLTDGEYTFRISAVDAATNVGGESDSTGDFGNKALAGNLTQLEPFAEPPSFSWRRPRSGDVASYRVGITGDNNSAAPVILIDFEDFDDSNFATDVKCDDVECPASIGDVQTVQVSVQGPGLTGDRIPDGTHRVGVKVVDSDGIEGAAVAITFQVDTTAPAPSPALQVDATLRITGDDRTPSLTWEPSTGDLITGELTSGDVSGLDHYRITLSGDRSGTFKEFLTEGLETEFTVPVEESLPDDQYRAEVEAVDLAGNRSDPATAEFFVDLLAPPVPENLVRGEPNPANPRSLGVEWDAFHRRG